MRITLLSRWCLLLSSLLLRGAGGPSYAQPLTPEDGINLAELGISLEDLASAEEQLEAELEKIKAAGEPLTSEEAAVPPVPDEENAAMLLTAHPHGVENNSHAATLAIRRHCGVLGPCFLYPPPPGHTHFTQS